MYNSSVEYKLALANLNKELNDLNTHDKTKNVIINTPENEIDGRFIVDDNYLVNLRFGEAIDTYFEVKNKLLGYDNADLLIQAYITLISELKKQLSPYVLSQLEENEFYLDYDKVFETEKYNYDNWDEEFDNKQEEFKNSAMQDEYTESDKYIYTHVRPIRANQSKPDDKVIDTDSFADIIANQTLVSGKVLTEDEIMNMCAQMTTRAVNDVPRNPVTYKPKIKKEY